MHVSFIELFLVQLAMCCTLVLLVWLFCTCRFTGDMADYTAVMYCDIFMISVSLA